MKPMTIREQKIVLTLLGVNTALIFALVGIGKWREKEIAKILEQYNIIADFGVASYKALAVADPKAAEKIAYDTKFAFIVADNKGE